MDYMFQSKDTGDQDGLKKKKDLPICCLQETHFKAKDICRLKVRGWRNIYNGNGHLKKSQNSNT